MKVKDRVSRCFESGLCLQESPSHRRQRLDVAKKPLRRLRMGPTKTKLLWYNNVTPWDRKTVWIGPRPGFAFQHGFGPHLNAGQGRCQWSDCVSHRLLPGEPISESACRKAAVRGFERIEAAERCRNPWRNHVSRQQRQTRLYHLRTEPPRSVPTPRGVPRNANKALSPPEEPPLERFRLYGLLVYPNMALYQLQQYGVLPSLIGSVRLQEANDLWFAFGVNRKNSFQPNLR